MGLSITTSFDSKKWFPKLLNITEKMKVSSCVIYTGVFCTDSFEKFKSFQSNSSEQQNVIND